MGYFMLITMVGALPYVPQRLAIAPEPKILLKPHQVCAIPLLNALKRPWNFDRAMVKQVPPPAPSKDVVVPPAPSCDDVR